MTEREPIRDTIAMAIFARRHMWSEDRAREHFAAYSDGPKNLEPEIAGEVAEAYLDADLAIEECAKIADACDEQDEIDNGAAATGAAKNVADLLHAHGERAREEKNG